MRDWSWRSEIRVTECSTESRHEEYIPVCKFLFERIDGNVVLDRDPVVPEVLMKYGDDLREFYVLVVAESFSFECGECGDTVRGPCDGYRFRATDPVDSHEHGRFLASVLKDRITPLRTGRLCRERSDIRCRCFCRKIRLGGRLRNKSWFHDRNLRY